ncbi:MAG: SDR family oxidoreductase [Myxococcota bacterium]
MPYASIFRPDLFAGQVGIVTGGGSGIGRCISHELASLGATVILASRDQVKLETVVQEIREDGGRADAIRCDIRKEEEVRALVKEALARHGRIDFLVNNGGGQFVSPLLNLSLKGWQAVIDTNLTGAFLMSKEVVNQAMADRGGGAIVNIVADMWRGMPMMGHSGAARAGVVNLTQTGAIEWAPHGVRVNACAPGLILSSGLANYPEPVQEAMKSLPAEIPARRFGTESEVSAAVVFLLSKAAAYITGETLCVDGALPLYRQVFAMPERKAFPAYRGFHRAATAPAGLDPGDGDAGGPLR